MVYTDLHACRVRLHDRREEHLVSLTCTFFALTHCTSTHVLLPQSPSLSLSGLFLSLSSLAYVSLILDLAGVSSFDEKISIFQLENAWSLLEETQQDEEAESGDERSRASMKKVDIHRSSSFFFLSSFSLLQ